MKSTQDTCIWLAKVEKLLNLQNLSIQVYSDKSFSISHVVDDEERMIFNSGDFEQNIDFNDLAYYSPDNFAAILQIQLDAANVDVKDL